MQGRWKVAGWVALVAVVAGAASLAYLIRVRRKLPVLSVQGAVIRQDSDLRRESPIADVEISASNVFAATHCRSDSSGYFWLDLPKGIAPGQSVALQRLQPIRPAVDAAFVEEHAVLAEPRAQHGREVPRLLAAFAPPVIDKNPARHGPPRIARCGSL